MKTPILSALLLVFVILLHLSCQKDSIQNSNQKKIETRSPNAQHNATSLYDLEVVLGGDGNQNGHLRFRQDADPTKIITLDIIVHNLLPNHPYQLQRAVDAIVDDNCTSIAWLTLGKGLVPQSILTNDKGDGAEALWRDVSSVPSGSIFDIHFRVVDAVSIAEVLSSTCYQYTVR